MDSPKTHLKNLSPLNLSDFFASIGEKPFRARQVMQWLFRYRVDSFEQMKNISKTLQNKLKNLADISKFPIVSKQEAKDKSAIKLAVGLSDDAQEVIECVVLFDGKRTTACLSTQLGCKFGCAYCSTALMGFHRNLSQQEILEQLIALQDCLGNRRITNVVFMGMGEPLDNLENVLHAAEIIQSDFGFCIGGRKITISTCGLAPKIMELADLKTNIGLAISLNAPNDKIRSKLVPLNRKYPIKTLLDAAEYYFKASGRRVTFEYVLIEGVNSSDENMRELAALMSPFRCKVNLIAFSPKPGCDFKSPSKKRIRQIVRVLETSPFAVTLRKSLGTEISAACGQLYREIRRAE